jgi:hypothetical protein
MMKRPESVGSIEVAESRLEEAADEWVVALMCSRAA